MHHFLIKAAALFYCTFLILLGLPAQNSLLVNFGSGGCTQFDQPAFSIINRPLQAPVLLASCPMQQQLPDFFSVFVAYNPSDNDIYICDNRTGLVSNIWQLDIGLPGSIICPASISTQATIVTNYVSNNFEFDNNGDLWSFSAYEAILGQCKLDKLNLATGVVLQSKVLQFPVNKFPTAITSGDVCILPNGRMFATLGSNPSRLYEIVNYKEPEGNARALFLTQLPANCYGIAYLNGQLEITGTSLDTDCYYFLYDIARAQLGPYTRSQLGQGPIDNTSITPALGLTKRLLSSQKIDASTADLVYEIYATNMGNVTLNSLSVSDDLGAVYGASNISNVMVRFSAGGNAGNLMLNSNFNGTTQTQLLAPLQQLKNQRFNFQDYFVKMELSFRVKELVPGRVYNNNALGKAIINNSVEVIEIVDISNNGSADQVDPNRNGVANEPAENLPTPFDISTLPVKFLQFGSQALSSGLYDLHWKVATPVVNGWLFVVEESVNGREWRSLTDIPINNISQSQYRYTVMPGLGNSNFYRIRQIDKDGREIYSPVISLGGRQSLAVTAFPNPTSNQLWLQIPGVSTTVLLAKIYDSQGRKVIEQTVQSGQSLIQFGALAPGVYTIQVPGYRPLRIVKKAL